ncbi:MAG TPA: hypothetical protein VGP16_30055 [Asanoa sp.]|nr:hypothetical protein [Asanoa sp.]
MTVNLAGVSSGATPALPVLFGAGVVFAAAAVAGVALRRNPGVPALSFALAVAALFPVAWHAPEWFGVSDHSAPLMEWPVICLELLAAAAVVLSVVQIRRAQARHEPRSPELEENFA